jgi:hypothetical protein
MKTKLLIFSIFIVLSFVTKAQQYVPFPDSNAIWRVDYCPYGVPINECYFYQYTLKGDTIINGKNFKIINVYGQGPAPNYIHFNCNIGALNQDIISRKIYFKKFNYSYNCFPVPFSANPNDSILFDFSLNIGDTLKQQCNLFYNTDTLFIQAIDSILIGNKYRKRFILGVIGGSPYGIPDIIEGIGSDNGLIEPIDNQFMYANYSHLVCYGLNDTSLYPSYSPNPCATITNIDAVDEVKNKPNIFPNPFNDNANISYALSEGSFVSINIYDLKGEIIFNIENGYKPKGNYMINFSNSKLLNGIYYFQFITNNDVSIIKIIKL